MGAHGDTPSAMNAEYGDMFVRIKKDGINRTGKGAFSAVNAELFLEQDASALSGNQGVSGTDRGAWRRIAGQADICLVTGADASG